MDWEDDDGPPDLVEAGIVAEADEKPIKVPLTIVTGEEAVHHIPRAGPDK